MIPAVSIRSVFRKKVPFFIDFSGFSLKSGWDSVYDYGKRVAGLGAFVVIAAALFPIWLPSQTAMQYQLDEHTRQLANLQNVPTDLAVLKAQVATQKEVLDGLTTKATMIIIGLVAWMGKEIFEYMGGKIGKRETS